jgi:hypothetical protein
LPSWAIDGSSSSRKPGSLLKPAAMSSARSALAAEVRRHDRRRALDRDRRAGLERGRLDARLAVDEVLADQRLRPGLAGHVGADRAEAGLGDVDLDQRAVGLLVDLHLADLARADAGDLHVAAGDQAEGVVELDPVGGLGVVTV